MEEVREREEAHLALTACGFAPIVGAGCDLEDARRHFEEGDPGQGFLSLLGLVSLGDLIKAPRAVSRLSRLQGGAGQVSRVGRAAIDANVLVRGLEGGQLAAVERALGGRSPVISITAAKEFLAKGDVNVLREFLASHGGSVGKAATSQQIQDLQSQATLLGRVIDSKDAAVAGSALAEGIPLITNDQRLFRFLNSAGLPAEFFP